LNNESIDWLVLSLWKKRVRSCILTFTDEIRKKELASEARGYIDKKAIPKA